MDKLAELTIENAIKSIGTEEVPRGSNWGPAVEKYLASVGINYAASWCAAWVYYEISTAAKSLGVPCKYMRSASCQAVYQWAKANGHLIPKPVEGSVFLQWHPELHRYAHTGLVRSVDIETNKFISVEGNSNSDGSREGYEVCSNNRVNTKGKYLFVQIV